MCLNSKYIGAMKKLVLLGLSVILCMTVLSQTSQIVRGKVLDKESQYPLDGATISLVNGDNKVISDSEGKFRMEGVPLGRQSIEVEYTFYKTRFIALIVTAGKEIVLNIDMEDAFTEIDGGVEITARKKGELNNDMASVSAKSFSVEETDRYAGSRSDPARMASNFAGVQGADDSKNDIVIRGISPAGVILRFEVIDKKERNAKLANTIGNHVCEFTKKELRDLVKESGFGVLRQKLCCSKQMSKKPFLRRILPTSLLEKLDYSWSKKKNKDGKDFGQIQILVAERFH